ncbi:MAG: hypothetical protein C5B47_07080 [Verrucomicrobia bacterium]|nr:MAG: hypothetical protein C5B47_07080 [Verrucomicrobiota bacterium]
MDPTSQLPIFSYHGHAPNFRSTHIKNLAEKIALGVPKLRQLREEFEEVAKDEFKAKDQLAQSRKYEFIGPIRGEHDLKIRTAGGRVPEDRFHIKSCTEGTCDAEDITSYILKNQIGFLKMTIGDRLDTQKNIKIQQQEQLNNIAELEKLLSTDSSLSKDTDDIQKSLTIMRDFIKGKVGSRNAEMFNAEMQKINTIIHSLD